MLSPCTAACRDYHVKKSGRNVLSLSLSILIMQAVAESPFAMDTDAGKYPCLSIWQKEQPDGIGPLHFYILENMRIDFFPGR